MITVLKKSFDKISAFHFWLLKKVLALLASYLIMSWEWSEEAIADSSVYLYVQ